ncbi:hypothetical protein [Tardiphaga sp. 619_E2_N8_5]|uniref:hypothetical protein n=1 Tax=unclassified Tardiphaga TaxID=2631404 RepID=UPI003F27BDA7
MLMEDGHPPWDQWKIWMGDYERGDWIPEWIKNALMIESDDHPARYLPDGVPMPNTQSTTLVFGRLYVHAFSSVHPDIVDMTGRPSSKVVQLAPVGRNDIQWPTTSLTDREADDAAGFILNALANATNGNSGS